MSSYFPKVGYSLGERCKASPCQPEVINAPRLIKGGDTLKYVVTQCLEELDTFHLTSVCILLTDEYYELGSKRHRALQISTEEKIKTFNKIGVAVKLYQYSIDTTPN